MKAEVRLNLPEIIRGIEKVTGRVIRAFTFDVVDRMKQSFALPKSGRVYKVSKTGRKHQASAPGEAPAVLFSTLKNSILTSFPKQTEGIITIGAEYAEALEKGSERVITTAWGRKLKSPRTVIIKPRPYVRPALDGALSVLDKNGIVGGLL